MTQERPPGDKPPDQTPPPGGKKPNAGWIESLAHRSAGLPGSAPPPKEDQDKSAWSHAGAGIQFALTTALFAFMGFYVDRHWNTSPWAILIFTSLGFVGGLYLLIKDALKENAGPPKKSGKP